MRFVSNISIVFTLKNILTNIEVFMQKFAISCLAKHRDIEKILRKK